MLYGMTSQLKSDIEWSATNQMMAFGCGNCDVGSLSNLVTDKWCGGRALSSRNAGMCVSACVVMN
jgi:hypothetical protein